MKPESGVTDKRAMALRWHPNRISENSGENTTLDKPSERWPPGFLYAPGFRRGECIVRTGTMRQLIAKRPSENLTRK
jgi:hypothetical protein